MTLKTQLERARRRAGGRLLHGFFHGLSAAGQLHPMARAKRHGVERISDLSYVADGLPQHRLDVWRPAGAQHAPALLYVHGGGFRILSKRTHWLMALAFARRGFVVFNIDYRLAPEHPFPAAIQDTCAAYRWVVDNAARFGANAENIVVAGESAGANLITSLCIACCFEREEPWAQDVFATGVVPVASVPACGMLDVSNVGRFEGAKLSRIVRDRIGEVSSGYLRERDPNVSMDLADPLVFLEGCASPARPLPPTFAPVGTRDPLLTDSRRLKVALEALGGTCEAPEYVGEHHAFHAFLWRDAARRCWDDTFRFLERYAPR